MPSMFVTANKTSTTLTTHYVQRDTRRRPSHACNVNCEMAEDIIALLSGPAGSPIILVFVPKRGYKVSRVTAPKRRREMNVGWEKYAIFGHYLARTRYRIGPGLQ